MAAGPSSVSFFGTGQKAMMQWIGRLLEATNDRIGETSLEAQEELAPLVESKKIISSILALLRSARKGGVESDEFREAASSQLEFLAMVPTVSLNVFPLFIRTSARRITLNREHNAAEFWKAMAPSLLGDDGMTLKEIQELQSEVLSSKLADFQSNAADFRQLLQEFFSDAALRVPASLVAGLEPQLKALGCLANHDTVDSDQLDEALTVANAQENTLANSLKLFPPGRLLLDAATSAQQRTRVTNQKLEAFRAADQRMSQIEALAEKEWDISTMRAVLIDALSALSKAITAIDEAEVIANSPGLSDLISKASATTFLNLQQLYLLILIPSPTRGGHPVHKAKWVEGFFCGVEQMLALRSRRASASGTTRRSAPPLASSSACWTARSARTTCHPRGPTSACSSS